VKGGENMIELNTDRSSWGMIALVVAGIAVGLVTMATTEIGNLVVVAIKALFAG